mgnify:CR=1 FL=1
MKKDEEKKLPIVLAILLAIVSVILTAINRLNGDNEE